MKEKKIQALMIPPKAHPMEVTLQNHLDALQKAVSVGTDYQGLIEVIPLEEGVCLMCNEEGKFNGLEPNRRFGDDILCGTFYIVGENKRGEFTSLPPEYVAKYRQLFWMYEDIDPDEILPMARFVIL
jgi:hypothetical protein